MSTPSLQAARTIQTLLSQQNYDAIATITHGRRLSAAEIRREILQYGGTPIVPPEEAFHSLDVVQIHPSAFPAWSVRMPVWTREEGQSDLSIGLTVTDRGCGQFEIELDELHVL